MSKKGINVANRTMFVGDNLHVLNGLNSESVDLIYLDPPFNSNRHYSAPVGSKAAGASFKDAWTLDDIDDAWKEVIRAEKPKLAVLIEGIGAVNGKGDMAYLIFMARRLIELHRALKESGSIYLHCDPTMSHALKMLMDCIFDKRNFRNEIVWCYDTAGRTKKHWNKKHDVILFYSKSKSYVFNEYRIERQNKTEGWLSWYPHVDDDGRRYQIDGKGYKYYADAGRLANDWWSDLRALHATRDKERTGYPTQKPSALLERIIKASSNEGDVVLDPFCGCATACIAAEKLSREWVGIDISNKAVELIRLRLQKEEHLWRQVGKGKHIIPRMDLPVRDDVIGVKIADMKKHKQKLYGECGGRCRGCNEHLQMHLLQIDHILPRSKGGQDIESNLQLLCGSCNTIKGNRPMESLMARLKELKR